jgi:class 3 adenylate cyclase
MKPANSPVDRQTRMAAVVFADLVGFSKKSVPAQLAAKEALTALLQELVTPYPKEGRVILDTGDGAAVGFLVSPEFALGLALRLRRELVAAPADALLQSKDLRLGINLGPLKVVTDVNGQPNMVGEGINSAERIMSFAEPGQTTASRSFQEAVYYLDASFQHLFEPLGMRTDKHGREHEVFRVTDSTPAIDTALQSLGAGAPAQAPAQRVRAATARPTRVVTIAAGIGGIAVVALATWMVWPARVGPAATSVKPPETVTRPAPGPPAPPVTSAPPAQSEPASAPVATAPVPVATPPVGEAAGTSAAPTTAPTAAPPPQAAPPPPAPRPAAAVAKPAPPPAKPPVAKPKSTLAGAPTTAAPTPAAPPTSTRVEGTRVSPRCAPLLQRATLGETLTPAEQHELVTACR